MYRGEKMKKIVIFWMLIALSISLEAKGDFLKKLLQLEKSKVIKIFQKMPKGSRDIGKNKYPKLIPFLKESPEKLYLADRSIMIKKRGSFEKRFFSNQTFNKQLSIITQSSKYGDNYFKIIKEISSISPSVIKKNLKVSKKVDVNKVSELTLQRHFIDTLNKTGKYGWKHLVGIQKWVLKNPKITGASAMYAWYILDPSGFNDALKESGKNLTEFLGSSIKAVAVGSGEVISEKVEEIGQRVIDNTVSNFTNLVENDLTEENVSFFKYIFALILFLFMLRKIKIVKPKIFNEKNRKTKNTKEDNEF
jgi:hypothetical protein